MATHFIPATQEELGIFLSCLEPTLAYNLPLLIPLGKEGDAKKAEAALRKVLSNHPYLDTVFSLGEGGALQKKIVPLDKEFELPVIKGLKKDELVQPFATLDEHLYRFSFIEDRQGNYLFADFHHMLMDGFSLDMFLKEFAEIYEGRGEGTKEGYTSLDFAKAKAELRADKERFAEDEAFYKESFDGIDVDSLPTQDKNDGEVAYSRVTVPLPYLKDQDIVAFTKSLGIRRSSFFLSAFAYTLGIYSFTDEASFLSVNNGRNQDVKKSYGMFVRTFPVYLRGMGEGSIASFLQETDQKQKDILSHDAYSFSDIVAATGFNADILFAYQGDYFYGTELDGKPVEVEVLPVKDGKEKIAIELFKQGNDYFAHVEYRSDLYEEDSLIHLMKSFAHVCDEFFRREDLGDIDPSSEEDKKILATYNEHDLSDYDFEADFMTDIRRHMKEKKDEPAVIGKDMTFTYGQLDDLSDRIAEELIRRGYHREQVVSILIRRNAYMGVAPIGVLKAGLGYQPLDPSYPDERLCFMMEDASSVLLIADRGLESKVPTFKGPIIFTDEIASLPKEGLPQPKPEPHDLFIMLYTSGSTGKPKGVQLERHNMSMFMQCQRKFLEIKPTDHVATYASFGFDANMGDIFEALTNGLPLYIIDEDTRLELNALNDYLERNGITQGMMTTQVGRQFVEMTDNKTLRKLVVGGEKLVPIEPPKNYTLINGYGPTECTMVITMFNVDKLYYRVPIGKSLEITHLFVFDKKMRPLPYGVPGYLYCSGHQVGRGYLNRPEENKKAFLDNPYEDGDYSKIYYTGDVVRFLKDGTLDFIGRKDGQVKIRGFRIELTEVESVLRQYPGVKDATVAAFPAPSGGNFIAAYLVSDETLDLEEVKAFVGERKPPYMVPEAIMQIDKIPLNQNSKVNKRALPIPKRQAAEVVPPSNKREEEILAIVKKVIGEGEYGVTNDLFEIGLTSISSIKLLSLLSEEAGLSLSTRELRENVTVRALASLGAKEEETFVDEGFYPLTKTQQGILSECLARPGSTIYNIPLLYELDPSLDLEALEKAVKQAIAAHPGLSSYLKMEGSDVVMVKNENPTITVERIQGEPPKPFVLKPYDLFKGPFYQAKIYQGAKPYLYLDTHHIASDGTSLALLLGEINDAMAGKPIESEKHSAFELAYFEAKHSTPEEVAKQKEYYASFLQGVDSPSLPKKDYELPEESTPKNSAYPLGVDASKVDAFMKGHGLNPNGFFNAAFALALAKWNGNDDALFTSIYSGRDDAVKAKTVTMLVKTLPVYAKVDPNEDRLTFVKEVSSQLQGSSERTLYSFAEASHDFDVKADVMFAYQGDGFIPDSIGGKKATLVPLDGDEAKAGFSVDCLYLPSGYELRFEYPANLYKEETMAGFAKLFGLIVKAFLEDGKLGTIELIDQEGIKEQEQYNQTAADFATKTYLDLLAKQVKEHPDRLAVIGIDETYTYAAFDEATDKVGAALLRFGVKPNDKVVTLTKRKAHAYIAREGVLKSGAAFLPIDPAYPVDRIQYILEDSEAKAILASKEIYEEKKADYPRAKFLILEDILALPLKEKPQVEIDPHSLAYCIYTSGSTGKPKGVMIEHHSLHNFVAMDDHNPIVHEYVDHCKVAASLASLSFDLSIQEEFIPLANGLSVMIATEDEILNPVFLAKRMREHKVDIITTTPSYVNNVLDIEEVMTAFRAFKVIDLGAEALPPSMVEKMRQKGMQCYINNGYGPTEATVACTMDAVTSKRITIGFPITNTKCYIIDKELRRLPFGAVGELLIAGEGVARGYIHRDDLNKDRFIEYDGLRAYRSGDLARLNYDGRIEFFGRKDNQVKLRGLRVELDEIENALSAYPGISHAVVIVKESPTDGQFLVGYYLSQEEADVNDLKSFLGQTLTPYMIPKVFMRLDSIPMTQNGKVDKKALPEPVLTKQARSGLRLPKNETQQTLYEIFKHVLGVEELSIDDDFFDLGGTSLSASKITMMAMEKGLPIAYADIFDFPTVADLSALVLSSKKENEKVETIEEKGEEGLEHNIPEEVDGVTELTPYHRVLLTGASGFLGIHILRELITQGKRVIALVRGGKDLTGLDRLKGLMAYYFDSPYDEELAEYVEVVEEDVTSPNLKELFAKKKIDFIINCAAIVKHFANDDSIERVNLGGVKNLIEVALCCHARLIQISTLSVAGENVGGKFPKTKRIHENEIYFGQDVGNKYINSKIKAEQALIDAVNTRGLDGKIIRVGNLMGRQEDGEFQANSKTNNFMASLRAYVKLGAFPVSAADSTIDFSAIDEVAKTILLLSQTPSKFTIFHSANSHEVAMADTIDALIAFGYPIQYLNDKEFGERLAEFIADEDKAMEVSSLLAYQSSDTTVTRDFILSDNSFTVKALYRLGYHWPITDKLYLERSIFSLASLGFFD